MQFCTCTWLWYKKFKIQHCVIIKVKKVLFPDNDDIDDDDEDGYCSGQIACSDSWLGCSPIVGVGERARAPLMMIIVIVVNAIVILIIITFIVIAIIIIILIIMSINTVIAIWRLVEMLATEPDYESPANDYDIDDDDVDDDDVVDDDDDDDGDDS